MNLIKKYNVMEEAEMLTSHFLQVHVKSQHITWWFNSICKIHLLKQRKTERALITVYSASQTCWLQIGYDLSSPFCSPSNIFKLTKR